MKAVKGLVKVIRDIPVLGYRTGDVIEHYGYAPGSPERCRCILVYPAGTEWQRLNIQSGDDGYAVLNHGEFRVISMKRGAGGKGHFLECSEHPHQGAQMKT